MRYFSFDAETDGLFGDHFAIAAVVMDEDERILASFSGKCLGDGIRSEWVRQHCLPYLGDLPDYPTRYALTEAFWQFYALHQSDCLILSDAPFPVEAGLMRRCIDRDPEARIPLSPFPLLDVMSMFHAHSLDPMTDRIAFASMTGFPHNPLTDAIASARCAVRLGKL